MSKNNDGWYFNQVTLRFWALRRKYRNMKLLKEGFPSTFTGMPLRWYESKSTRGYDVRRVACYFNGEGSVWLELSETLRNTSEPWWTFMCLGRETSGYGMPVGALAEYINSQGHDILTAHLLADELCTLIAARYESHRVNGAEAGSGLRSSG